MSSFNRDAEQSSPSVSSPQVSQELTFQKCANNSYCKNEVTGHPPSVNNSHISHKPLMFHLSVSSECKGREKHEQGDGGDGQETPPATFLHPTSFRPRSRGYSDWSFLGARPS